MGDRLTGTPDGREGWEQFFLRHGCPVYVVDEPGRGRAAYETDLYGQTAPLNFGDHPKAVRRAGALRPLAAARLHTQWPGTGAPGDPVFNQCYASIPSMRTSRCGIVEAGHPLSLLEKIGPSILLTHSQSGPSGWLLEDARPNIGEGHRRDRAGRGRIL